MPEPLYVTKSFLPPLSEFTPYLEQIWDTHILTNGGPFHTQLEEALATYLGVRHVSLFTNGTLALMTSLQTLRISGDVITTPFSFPATSHALLWNGIQPVFCDIEPKTFNIDPDKIEDCITPGTKAILPVHVFGNPCRVDEIQSLATLHGLKVIYDACHSFGVRKDNNSILNAGDLSVLSFHATKIFNTFEGGAIVSNDEVTKQRIDFLKNFGYLDETTIVTPGINGKMSEVQAAMGLLQLKTIDERIDKLKAINKYYRERLAPVEGIRFLQDLPSVTHNYSYFPIFIDEKEFGVSRDKTYEQLQKKNVFTRRYFYPLISEFPVYKSIPSAHPANLPVATAVAKKILCLPNYAMLTHDEIDHVCDSLIAVQRATSAGAFAVRNS